MFSVCPPSIEGTISPSHNTSTGPTSFPGVPQSQVGQGTPIPGGGGVTPVLAVGYPSPRQGEGVPHSWLGGCEVFPIPSHCSRTEWDTPLVRSGWGTPSQDRMGYLPGPGYGYAMGSMPLAVSRRRTVLLWFLSTLISNIHLHLIYNLGNFLWITLFDDTNENYWTCFLVYNYFWKNFN